MDRPRIIKIVFPIAIVVIVLLAGFRWYLSPDEASDGFVTLSDELGISSSQAVVKQFLTHSFLNGTMMARERAHLPVLAIMIENSPPARPQSALDKADVVYETLAEGGITRFMALFQSQEAEVVGPVRSARTYFAEIVREYEAWYVHVGGNADAMKLIAQYDLHDLDQFFIDKPFWRDSVRRKQRGYEHSLYTNTVDLRQYAKVETETTHDLLESWSFGAEESDPQDRPSAQTIHINFSSPAFAVKWEYDPVVNVYQRFQGGVVHQDAQTDLKLTAKNVLLQYVVMSPVLDPAPGDVASINIQLVGKGEGVLFRDGKAFPLTWKKEKSGARTQFFDANGQTITFNRGIIWVELVEKEMVDFL